MKKLVKVLLCLVVGGVICVVSAKQLDGIPEFCLVVGTVEIACLIMMSGSAPKKSQGELFIERAVAEGRVVTARKVKERFIAGSNKESDPRKVRRDRHVATYEYEVNGSTYRRKQTSYKGEMPGEMTLYYLKSNPEKAISEAKEIVERPKVGKVLLIMVLGLVVYGILKLVFDVDYASLLKM